MMVFVVELERVTVSLFDISVLAGKVEGTPSRRLAIVLLFEFEGYSSRPLRSPVSSTCLPALLLQLPTLSSRRYSGHKFSNARV